MVAISLSVRKHPPTATAGDRAVHRARAQRRQEQRGRLVYNLRTITSTTGVLAATPDFHDVRFLGFFAVFAAVFAVLFRRTIARGVSTFPGVFFSHEGNLLTRASVQIVRGIVRLC